MPAARAPPGVSATAQRFSCPALMSGVSADRVDASIRSVYACRSGTAWEAGNPRPSAGLIAVCRAPGERVSKATVSTTKVWALRPRRCLPPMWCEIVPTINAARRIAGSCEPARTPAGGRPVLLIPGLFAGDRWLRRLRQHLEASGYDVWDSTIACNLACSESMAVHLGARLEEIVERTAAPVTIVGHSRGGLLGRVLARRRPELVSGLVMLGSPCRDQLAVHPLLWVQLLSIATLGSLGVRSLMRVACGASTCCERFREDLDARSPTTCLTCPSTPVVTAWWTGALVVIRGRLSWRSRLRTAPCRPTRRCNMR
jgi:pimeloyl-ACP methyl ester carboxylesterase